MTKELREAAERAIKALEATEALDSRVCEECNGEGEPEACPECFPAADDARLARRESIVELRDALSGPSPDTGEADALVAAYEADLRVTPDTVDGNATEFRISTPIFRRIIALARRACLARPPAEAVRSASITRPQPHE